MRNPMALLLVLIATGKPLALPLEFKLDAGLVALLVPIIYVVGMIIDFLALMRVLRENVCHKSATTAERLPKLAAITA